MKKSKPELIKDINFWFKAERDRMVARKKIVYASKVFCAQYADLLEELAALPSSASNVFRISFYPEVWSCSHISFNYATRAHISRIMRVLAADHKGPWSKEYGSESVNYSKNIEIAGVFLRIQIYGGELPPHCHIETEKVYIPEQIIPGHHEIVNKVVCKKG